MAKKIDTARLEKSLTPRQRWLSRRYTHRNAMSPAHREGTMLHVSKGGLFGGRGQGTYFKPRAQEMTLAQALHRRPPGGSRRQRGRYDREQKLAMRDA